MVYEAYCLNGLNYVYKNFAYRGFMIVGIIHEFSNVIDACKCILHNVDLGKIFKLLVMPYLLTFTRCNVQMKRLYLAEDFSHWANIAEIIVKGRLFRCMYLCYKYNLMNHAWHLFALLSSASGVQSSWIPARGSL